MFLGNSAPGGGKYGARGLELLSEGKFYWWRCLAGWKTRLLCAEWYCISKWLEGWETWIFGYKIVFWERLTCNKCEVKEIDVVF